MRGPAKAIVTSIVMVCGVVPRPALAVAPQPASTTTPGEASPTTPAQPREPMAGDDPLAPELSDPAPATGNPPDTTPVPEPEPEPEPEPQPEPQPSPETVQPQPAPAPAVSTGAAPFPAAADDDTRPARSKRALGLGLLVAGSGFVVIGATTAGLYGATQKRCGGSCIGGAIAAATGIAGVVVGAIVLSRSRGDVALRSGARVVARWKPGRGLSF